MEWEHERKSINGKELNEKTLHHTVQGFDTFRLGYPQAQMMFSPSLAAISRKFLILRERVGWRNLRKALDSI
jgi:hypothetical protein